MKPRIIYLDMDDVCVDFVKAYLRLIGSPLKRHQIDTWSLSGATGLTDEEFWDKIDAAGVMFWEELPVLPWFQDLYQLCMEWSKGNVVFLTNPTNSPYAAAGKLWWIRHNFGKDFKNWIFTSEKHLIGSTGDVLIDDSERNINKWTGQTQEERLVNGKRGILFPAPWNSLSELSADPMAHVRKRLLFQFSC